MAFWDGCKRPFWVVVGVQAADVDASLDGIVVHLDERPVSCSAMKHGGCKEQQV